MKIILTFSIVLQLRGALNKYLLKIFIMKTTNLFLGLFALISVTINAQLNFGGTPLPSRLGNANNWQLIENSSDDFNYTFNPTNNNANFGPPGKPAKWNNFFHNGWEGPGPTKWQRNHCAVSGGNLNIWASRRFRNNNFNTPFTKSFDGISRPETIAGCITSKTRVKFPVFVEAKLTIMNSSLASDVWLLSPDDTEEIDIIECYGGGGNDGRNNFFANRIHLSHHVFRRSPFTDYQPADFNSWYRQNNVAKWGGRVVRIGVNWKSATVLEYYINGNLVRVLDNDAIASKLPNGVWQYTYPAGVSNGKVTRVTSGAQSGFQKMIVSSTSSGFNQNNLNRAKNQSNISVLDPFNYLNNGKRFSKAMDIIINVEDQSWQARANRSPNNTEIRNFNNNNLLVDWIRVYKPKNNNTGGGNNNGGGVTSGRYDFGTNSSPVFNGYKRVSYNSNSNIWANRSGINYADRGNNGGVNNINRDFAYGKDANRTIRVNVANGTYNVTATFGDRIGARRNNRISSAGKTAGVNTNAGQFKNATLNGVRVTNGQLSVLVSAPSGQFWTINRLVFNRTGNKSLTDVQENNEESIVYPNPANIGENVTITSVIGAEVNIVDVSGRIIDVIPNKDGTVLINTSNLTSGMYFIQTGGKTKKLILK